VDLPLPRAPVRRDLVVLPTRSSAMFPGSRLHLRGRSGLISAAQALRPANARTHQEREYCPNVCSGIDVRTIKGDPRPPRDPDSYVERQPLMRTGITRSTRLTNRFSSKVENLAHVVTPTSRSRLNEDGTQTNQA